MTLRKAMDSGERGDFARLLVAAFDNQHNIISLLNAFYVADSDNQARLLQQFPGLDTAAKIIWHDWPTDWKAGLSRAFEGLCRLDEEFENPHAIDIVSGQARDAPVLTVTTGVAEGSDE